MAAAHGYVKYIALPAAQAVLLPTEVDFAAGACFGIPLLTAIHAVKLAGELRGKTVLVTGAGSSVGFYAAQIVKLEGGRVIGTVGSEAKAKQAAIAGVESFVHYKTESVGDRVKALTQSYGVDAVIDLDFSTSAKLIAEGALANHGVLVCYGSNLAGGIPIDFRACLGRSVSLRFLRVYDLLAQDRAFALQRVQQLLASRALMHAIGVRLPLAGIAAAHESVEAGSGIGNVVLDIE